MDRPKPKVGGIKISKGKQLFLYICDTVTAALTYYTLL